MREGRTMEGGSRKDGKRDVEIKEGKREAEGERERGREERRRGKQKVNHETLNSARM